MEEGMMGMEWAVEFSRFFNFPIRTSYSRHSLDLKVLPRFKSRSGGTWLHPSPAVLRLAKPRPSSATVLSILVAGDSYEEHFASNIHISWPQTSCASECSANRIRVLFFTFTSHTHQIQKFAVKFSTLLEMEAFLDVVKESSKDMIDLEASAITCDDVSLCGNYMHPIQQRFDEELSIVDPIPTLTFNDESINFLHPAPAENIKEVFSDMPPSFTDLLIDCSTKKAKGQTQLIEDPHTLTERCILDSMPNVSLPGVANALEQPISEITMNSELVKYMSNASFQNMLAKIENVITELGGELGL